MKYTTYPTTKQIATNFKTTLKAIAIFSLFTITTKAQTTFTANVVKSDTIKSAQMIDAMGVITRDTLRAKDHVVIEQNLELQRDVSLMGRFDIGNGFAFKTYPANTNHPTIFRFGSTSAITPGAGINPPLDPEDMPSCATPFLGVSPLYSFGGALKVNGGITGSAVFAHDGANGIIDIQGLSNNNTPGSLLINYYCHRNVAICTGVSPNPTENKVFIGDFLNARKHVEIGDATYGISDVANTALDVFTNAGKGIKFTTYNNTMPLISVANSNFATSPFNVFGDGRVQLQSSQALTKVFTVLNPSLPVNSQEKFVVFGDGKTVFGNQTNITNTAYININTSGANAIEVYGATNNREFLVTSGGSLYAREIRVKLGSIPDYVFESNYKLLPLSEVEAYYTKYKHLPEVASEKEILANNLNVGEMSATLLKKVEELTLYLVEQNKQLEIAKKEIELLKNLIKK